MKYFGCAYYPEAWPRERREYDIRLMREAGLNLVRLGEFNWGRFEPNEGIFDFSMYHEVLDLLHKYGLKAMLCTPTAAAPRWLGAGYPETLKMIDGSRIVSDNRRFNCLSSPEFRRFVHRIVHKMGEEFKNHPAVVSWQIDNEIAAAAESPYCQCPQCSSGFREYLQEKYQTLENLNRAWNGAFWSSDFRDWEHIRPPFERLSRKMDYGRFQSRLHADFATEQYRMLKILNPAWGITTNSWTTFIPDVEPSEIFQPLDFASADCYINNDNIAFFRSFWDLYRNIKGSPHPFAVGETGAWNRISTHRDCYAALRVWMWEMAARGAESILYFRWRQSLMGEENHPAILPWSGKPGEAYRRIAQNIAEFREWESRIPPLPLPENTIAILHDPVTAFYHKAQNSYDSFRETVKLNSVICSLGLSADILPVIPETSIRQYRVLLLPVLRYISPEWSGKLKEFVADGGIILSGPRLAQIDENGKYLPEASPCGLTNLFGLEINEYSLILNYTDFKEFRIEPLQAGAPDEMPLTVLGETISAAGYMEHVELAGAEVIEYFSAGRFLDKPLLTVQGFGAGRAYYLAACLQPDGLKAILRKIFTDAGLTCRNMPDSVCRVSRGGTEFLFNPSPLKYTLEDGTFIPSYGVVIR